MMATSDDGSSRWYFWGMTLGQPTMIAIVNATIIPMVNATNRSVSQVFAASSPPSSIHRRSFSLQSEK